MGFDISYHPISEAEMHEWYFDLNFSVISGGDHTEITKLGTKYNIDEFYVDKYIETVITTFTAEDQSHFDKGSGYAVAVIQGFFRPFYYTRGSAFSFLIEDKPSYKNYTKKWEDISDKIAAKYISNAITENYMSGVYIPANSVVDLLNDYETKPEIKKELEGFYEQNLPVFLKALEAAKLHKMGLLEATEVVEPNPMDLNNSTCYSNLFNCDKDGVFIYADVAKEQIRAALASRGDDLDTIDPSQISYRKINVEPEKSKKTFWQKLFGK